MTLRQPVETQQQMIEILLQMRPGTGGQRVEVLRLVVERLQDRQLQRQSALADDPARFLNDRRRGAVGELRIKRRQGDLGDALPGQTRQRGLNGGLAVAHRQLHRALRPVRTYRLVQTATQHHQRRTFRPPDRGVRMRRLLGALDQDQRDQQAPQRPRQINNVRIHQKLVEVAAYISDFRGGRRTQIDQQQRLLCHATFLTTVFRLRRTPSGGRAIFTQGATFREASIGRPGLNPDR